MIPLESEKNKEISEVEGRENEVERLKRQLEQKEQELVEMRKKIEEIIEKRPKPEVFPEKVAKYFEEERKKIREELKHIPEEEIFKPISPRPQPLPSVKVKKEEIEMDLKKIMAMEKPKQVKTLIHLAFERGLWHSVMVALKLNDPYILDEFHDTLVDELYELLIKKGKLKRLK